MNYHQNQAERSYAEVRFLVFFTAGFFLLALGLGLLWALDTNGDNLDDTWEAQYGITTNAYASTNLVGWWQLNGTNNTDNATDRSGNGINGTLRGFPSVAYRQGLFSNALYFTTNASVSFPVTNSALSVTNQFTFSGWFRTTNNLTQPATLATWSDGHTNSWSVGVATNGVAKISFINTNSTQTVMATNNALNLYDGNWHAVTATYATNQVATVYVDGTGEVTNTITNWTPSAVSSFTFGTTNTNVVMNPYILDEARLYNRAMSATEVPQLPVTYSDLNGSGLSVYQDYLEGFNPFSMGTIVTTGFINSGLTGYYGSSAPTLTKTGGDAQTVSANTFAPNPLVVQVKNSSGTTLVGAPITFTIPSGSDGGVALTSGGTTTTSLSLVTDSSGNATVYYQSGPDTFKTNTITATAVYTTGNVSVSFTARCGVQSGLTLWLKADVGITTDGSGNVSQWNDQSPSGYNATQTTSTIRPAFVSNVMNGNPVVRLNGSSNYMSLPSGFSNFSSGTTVFAVFNPTTTANYSRIFDIGNGAPSNNIMLYRDGSAAMMQFACFNGTTAATVIGNSSLLLNVPQEYTGLESSSSIALYKNGSQLATSTGVALQNLTRSSNYIGKSNWGGNALYQGDMAEILIYNRPLSSTEQQQVEVYLADKYGLYHPNATWPLAYSSAVQTEITRNQWNKTQADAYVTFLAANPPIPGAGLALWLKADAGVTADGSGNVSQWNDQSANQYNATQSSTARPTVVTNIINGNPIIRFNGSAQYMSMPAGFGNFTSGATVFSVFNPTTTANYARIFDIGNGAPSDNLALYRYGAANAMQFACFNGGTAATVIGSGDLFLNMFQEYTGVESSSSIQLYRDGLLINQSSGIALQNIIRSSNYIGKSNWGGNALYQGDMAEIIIYNRTLSSTEQQQVELYLVNKYGLYYTLPAPTITPNGGSFTSSTTVTISAAPSPAVVRYTLDGTPPTNSSLLYTGTFTLTQSAPVNCAILLNNVPISPVATAQFYVGDTGHIGISDAWQMTYFGHTGIDPTADPMNSGLSNLQKYLFGYDPTKFSSNGDGLSDAVNHQLGIAGNNYYISSDGLTNAQNLALGIDPFNTNEAPITPPAQNPNDHTAPTINLNQPGNATLLP
jgi:hypothetical protein